jgi:hypothetical protein
VQHKYALLFAAAQNRPICVRRKYGYRIDPDSEGMGIYRLRPRAAVAWRESDYPRSATRWVFPD